MDAVIKKKSETLIDAIARIKHYKSRISEFMLKFEPDINKKYEDSLIEAERHVSLLDQTLGVGNISISQLRGVLSLYDTWGTLEKHIAYMHSIVSAEKWITYITIGMSQTFNDEVRAELASVTHIMEKITIINQEVNQSATENIKNSIISESEKDEAAETSLTNILLHDDSKINDLTVAILTKFRPKYPTNIKKLTGYSEKLKNQALGCVGYMVLDESLPAEQQLLSRFSIAPVTEYMTKEEACKFIGIESFDEVPKDFGLIILNKYSQTPIQYNILPLINYEYTVSHDLVTSEMSGLNKKIIRRFQTIKLLTGVLEGVTGGRLHARILKISENSSDSGIYVIEGLNNTYYRFLSDKFGNGTAESIKISKSAARKVINGPSDRPAKYLEHSEDIILANGVNRNHKKLLVSYMEKQFSAPSSSVLKEELSIEFGNLFKQYYEKNAPVNLEDAQNLMTKISFGSKNILRKKMFGYVFGKNGTKDAELLVSFGFKFESTYKFFSREMLTNIADAISSGILREEIFADNNPRGVEKNLREIFNKIVQNVIESMDTKPSRWVSIDLSIKNHAVETGLYE